MGRCSSKCCRRSLKARYETLSPEERTLLALSERLVQDYDDKIGLPDVPPDEMLRYLMKHRTLKQADLVPVIGTRSQVSDIVNGKRGISKEIGP